MKNSDWLEVEIRRENVTRPYTKGQITPLLGWPKGKDPYPDNSDEDIVMYEQGPSIVRIKGKCRKYPGDEFDLDGIHLRTMFVQEIKLDGEVMGYYVEAIGRL